MTTASIAMNLPATGSIPRPARTRGGDRIAAVVEGSPVEKYLKWMYAGPARLSVAFILFGGGAE